MKKTLAQLIFTTEDTEDTEKNRNKIPLLSSSVFSVFSVFSVVNLLGDKGVNICVGPWCNALCVNGKCKPKWPYLVSPEKAKIDALHIATATIGGMDYLLTWNCAHIANPSIRSKIESVIRSFGYEPPIICTPLELLEV